METGLRPRIVADCIAEIASQDSSMRLFILKALKIKIKNPWSEIEATESLGIVGSIGRANIHLDASTLRTIQSTVFYALQSPATVGSTLQEAAINAFISTLHLFGRCFESKRKRDVLMNCVFIATRSHVDKIQLLGLQCLRKILKLQYRFMDPYLNGEIITIVCETFEDGRDIVELDSLKLFLSFCEAENKLAMESQQSKGYINNAREEWATILLNKLMSQDRHARYQEMLMNCVKEFFTICRNGDVMKIAITFINDNISSEDSRRRKGALRAFYLLVECVNMSGLIFYVDYKEQALIELLRDEDVDVRIMTVQVFASIFENFPRILKNQSRMEKILEALLLNLNLDHRLTSSVCIALVGMSNGFHIISTEMNQEFSETFWSCYFNSIVSKCFEATNSAGAHQSDLLVAVHKALGEIVKIMPTCCSPIVQATLQVILTQTIDGIISTNFNQIRLQTAHNILPSQLEILKIAIEKLDQPKAIEVSGTIMQVLLTVMERDTIEDAAKVNALLAMASLVEQINGQFLMYMKCTTPHILYALKDHRNELVCSAAIQLVGHLARFSNELSSELIPLLVSNEVQHDLKEKAAAALRAALPRSTHHSI